MNLLEKIKYFFAKGNSSQEKIFIEDDKRLKEIEKQGKYARLHLRVPKQHIFLNNPKWLLKYDLDFMVDNMFIYVFHTKYWKEVLHSIEEREKRLKKVLSNES